jgi:hypothetical protein
VQGDEIGAGEQIVELHLLDAEIERALGRQEGVEGDDAHAQADAALGDDAADIAAADHAERLAGDLDAHEAVLLPLAGLRRGVGGGDFARQREHQRDGVFGRRDRIAEGRVHDDDAPAVAAGMSTLSTPMPARPMTFRRFAFSRIFGVTLVAERMARPS